MKLLYLASLVGAAVAFPGRSGQTLPYSPPLASDSRSPCPGLNTLANHGYLYVYRRFRVPLDSKPVFNERPLTNHQQPTQRPQH